MAEQPDGIVLRRHRDLVGRHWQVWLRRVLVGVVALVALLALLGFMGQTPSTTTAKASPASLSVSAPDTVRGGLLYQARFTIRAHRSLKDATLVLNRGWFDGLTIDTIEPSPVNQASRNGAVVFELGHVPAGSKYVLYMEYQVNPTTVSSRTLRVRLEDGQRKLVSLSRHFRILP
jgi:hypothetical protein